MAPVPACILIRQHATPFALGKRSERHHYVPRFYLELFGTPLYCFDKQGGRAFKATATDVALEKGFYELDPGIDFEAQIAQFESRFSDGLRDLVRSRNPTVLSRESKMKIALFVALQFIRTRDYRELVKEASGKFLTELMRRELGIQDSDFKVVMKEEAARAFQAQSILEEVPYIAAFLGNLRWSTAINRTKIPYWTSDNPVALFNPVDYGDQGNLGFNVRGIQVHFPLTRDLLLAMLDPASSSLPPITLLKRDVDVEFENNLQVHNANRFVISSTPDFTYIRKVLEGHPELTKPKERITLRSIDSYTSTIFHMTKKELWPRQ